MRQRIRIFPQSWIGIGVLALILASATDARAVDVDATAAAGRLGAALRFPTVSLEGGGIADPAAFEGFRDFLQRTYPAVHSQLRRELIAEHSLLYSWGEARGPAILFAAHQDVVPVESEKWKQPPFAGIVDGEFVWGRGALDDKGSLLGILEAVEHLVGLGFKPNRKVYLAFGHDEETDGSGARAISRALAERGEQLEMVLDEGGYVLDGVIPNVARPVAVVGVAEKGFLTVELSAEGGGGHSSVPPATTAVGRIARAVTRLEDTPMPGRLGPVVLAQLRQIAPELPWLQRVALSQPWLFGGLIRRAMESKRETAATVRTTTAVTVIRGGVKDNVLPRHASSLVNFRILPGDSVDAILDHVRDTIDDEQITIRIVGTPTEPSRVSSADSASYAAISRTLANAFPHALVAPSLVLGMTDARSYEPIADDVYRLLPIRLETEDIRRIHGTDERISIEAHAAMIDFYVRLLENLVGPAN